MTRIRVRGTGVTQASGGNAKIYWHSSVIVGSVRYGVICDKDPDDWIWRTEGEGQVTMAEPQW